MAVRIMTWTLVFFKKIQSLSLSRSIYCLTKQLLFANVKHKLMVNDADVLWTFVTSIVLNTPAVHSVQLTAWTVKFIY